MECLTLIATLLFPEYSSSASFMTVFETHAENGEVPADFTSRVPTGGKATVRQVYHPVSRSVQVSPR
jgi:hypothetical protein